MELRDYIQIVRKYWRFIALGAVVGIVIGMALNFLLGWFPLYSTTVTVIIGGDVATVEQNTAYTTLGNQFLETYADLATRDVVLAAVIDRLRLDETIGDLEGRVNAEIVNSTQLLEITVTDSDPEMAAAIANAIANELIALSTVRVRDFVELVEEAKVPSEMDGLWFLVLLISGTLGAVAVGGVAFLVEFWRDPVYSAKELTRRTELPVLTVIRREPRRLRDFKMKKPVWRKVSSSAWWPLVQACQQALAGPNGTGEAYREPKSISVLVTSPTHSQAKEIVAVNLATTWAKSDAEVVLVDADLQTPILSQWFQMSNEAGLVELLSGNGHVPDANILGMLKETDIPSLKVVPAGDVARYWSSSTPASGLTPKALSDVLEELSKHADVVIVSGPPLLTYGDATLLASVADGTLLALEVGRTPISAAGDAHDALVLMDSKVLGAILTEVSW